VSRNLPKSSSKSAKPTNSNWWQMARETNLIQPISQTKQMQQQQSSMGQKLQLIMKRKNSQN